MIVQWAVAEYQQGHEAAGRRLYHEAVARDSNLALGWTGIAIIAMRDGNPREAAWAAQHLERIAPDKPELRRIHDYLARARAAGWDGIAAPDTVRL
jgi:predicted Zn-dependent protease